MSAMSTASRIFRNTVAQVIGRAVGTVLALLTVGLMTRALGPDGYGRFTTAVSFLQFVGVLADFGLTMTMAKMLAAPGVDESHVASNIMTLRLTTALVCFGLAPAVSLLFPYSGEIRGAIAVGMLSYLFMSLSSVMTGLFQKNLATRHAAAAEVAGRVVLLAGVVAAIRLHAGLPGFMVTLAAANLVQLAWCLAAARRFVILRPRFDFSAWQEIARESWPIAVSIAFNLVYLKGDVIVMSLFRSDAEVGLYGAAYKVLDVVTVVPTVFMGLVLPILANDWQAGRRDEVRRKIALAFDAMALFAIPLFVGTVFVARDLMTLVGSERFAPSGHYLIILMLAAVGVCLGSAYTYSAVSLGLQKKVFWLYGIDAALSTVLYFIFVPRFGGDGGAWVTVFSEFFISIACAVAVIRASRAWPPLVTAAKALTAAVIMAAVLNFTPHLEVLLRIGLGTIVFAAAALALRVVDVKRIRALVGARS
jgi:O-antigen/teichoic acid export membrane protein